MTKNINRSTVGNVATLLIKKKFLIISFLLTIFFSFLAGFLSQNIAAVAVVNGEAIKRATFLNVLLKQGGKPVLNTLVAEKLIEQEMKQKKIGIKESEIKEKIYQLEKQLKLNNLTLNDFLTHQNKTYADLAQEIRIQLLIEKRFRNEITILDREIDNYLAQNRILKGTGAIYESQKIAVNRLLYQQKLREKLQKWLYETQKSASIRYFITF